MPDFGYAVGDFLAIVKLAWQLYDSCYQVIKDAPGEFIALCNELGALNIALTHVQNDLTRPESKLLQHGEDRLKSLKMASDNLNLTLLQLAKIIGKYKPVVRKTTSATVWNKIRWTLEQNNIVKIRLKLTSHVATLNLIVSSIGNSSLERIECILQRMDIRTLGPRCEGTNVLLEGSQGIHEGATGQGQIADDLVIENLKSTCGRVLATEEETRPLFSNHTGDAGSVHGIQCPGFEFGMCVPDSPAHSPAMNDENPRNGRKTMLHWAAENGWHSVAEKLLAIEDPNSKDELGQTPLHLAAKKGSESVVKLLLTRGADSTARDNSGLTPLHRAIESGSEAVVNLLPTLSELMLPTAPSWLPLHEAASKGSVQMATWLLDRGVDSTLQDSNGDTALHVAACKGTDKVVLLLLDYGMDGNVQNHYGETPLHVAVDFEQESIARILLGRGADLMIPAEDGNTAFHNAVTCCSLSMTKLFLEKGADINTTGQYRSSVLHVGLYSLSLPGYKVEEMVKFLLRNGALPDNENDCGETPLFDAVRSNHSGIVRELLARGACADKVNDNEESLLHAAAQEGYIAIVKILLTHKVDRNAVDCRGRTPLQMAAESGRFAVAKLLMDAGSKMSVQDNSGNTILHSAIHGRCLPLIDYLLRHGADVNATNNRGETSLQYLLSSPGPTIVLGFDLVHLLLNHGADWNLKDKQGRTALHFAMGHNLSTLKLLLEREQDVNCPDVEGWTPLHLSVRTTILCGTLTLEYLLDLRDVDHHVTSNNGQTVLHYLIDWDSNHSYDEEKGRRVELLLKMGVEIDAQDKMGETALHIAARKGSDRLVKLLVESGANLALTNANGKTAFEIAAERSRSESVAILLFDRGAGVPSLPGT